MNINSDNLQLLYSFFTDLNDKYQKKVIEYVIRMGFEQKAEEALLSEGGKASDYLFAEKLKTKNADYIKRANDFAKTLYQLDKEGLAQLMFVMENLSPGSFTKQDEISITINSKKIPQKDVFDKNFPDLDYSVIRDKADKNFTRATEETSQKKNRI
ncbi:MAG: hypothetical protein PHE26_01035 [Syntrophomonadaceae bacterium]|nr:hypothetical protein [Syntrophomonadaceae bacterium]